MTPRVISGVETALTVCSVSYHNAPHLILNWDLTRRLNPSHVSVRWVIAENTPDGQEGRLRFDDDRFLILPGVTGFHRVSYHHTEALQKTLAHVDTRFLLVLDPDFYIVREGWVEEIIRHMLAHDLALFGVPWHPKYIDKFRYFPTVHCVFVDLEKIPVTELDFRPWGPDEPPVTGTTSGSDSGSSPLKSILRMATLSHRRKEYRDSGTRMYYRYARDPNIKYECLQPVYRLPDDFLGSGNPLSWKSRMIESVLPDHLCYLPKRRSTFTSRGFREMQFGPAIPAWWEEFVWKGEPFGFHVRRNAKKSARDETAELLELHRAVEGFYETIKGVAAPVATA